MTALLNLPLADLSANEFERLCFELMKAEEYKFHEGKHSIFSSSEKRNPEDHFSLKLAMEVKHRTQFNPMSLELCIADAKKQPEIFDTLVYFTSAPIPKQIQGQIERITASAPDLQVKVFGQQDIKSLLFSHRTIAEKFFKKAASRKNRRRMWLGLSSMIIGASMTTMVWTITNPADEAVTTPSLESKITAVENNLQGLKSLENSLHDLKAELQEKSIESVRIQRDYEEALKLKLFTEEEINRFKRATSVTDPTETFLNYFIGFIVGVFGSILATIITDMWKTRRAMGRV